MNKKIFVGFAMFILFLPLVFADPETLLYDGFESATILPYWNNTGGTTTNWTISTNDPSQGTYHLRGANTDSMTYLTTYIDTYNYRDIILQFDYRTIGLDSDDEFVVEWYDGNIWNSLLSVKSGTSAYVTETIKLPSLSNYNKDFGIRFGILSTASNDIARVDEIYVFGTFNGELLPNSILGFMIITGLFFITSIFVALTIHFDNEMKFVFFILIFLSVSFNLNVMLQIGNGSGLATGIVDLLGVMYKVSLWLFMFITFYSMIKIFLALKISKKVAVETTNPNLNKQLPK